MGIRDWFKKESAGKEKNQPPSDREMKEIIIGATGKKSGLTVLEAGASGGIDTVEWAAFDSVKKIYAFEPVQKSFEELQRITANNPKVETFKLALSDKGGEILINISTNENRPDALSSSSSILPPSGHLEFHKHISFAKQEKVKVTTIDEWRKIQGGINIDIMWLDMQGAEHLALKGAINTLKNVRALHSEVSLKPMYEGCLLYPEFTSLMKSFGFEVHSEYLLWEDMGNVLFVKK